MLGRLYQPAQDTDEPLTPTSFLPTRSAEPATSRVSTATAPSAAVRVSNIQRGSFQDHAVETHDRSRQDPAVIERADVEDHEPQRAEPEQLLHLPHRVDADPRAE